MWGVRTPALALTCAAGVLCFLQLGDKSLWHDEAFSIALARLNLSSLWTAITSGEAFSGLYYLVLKPWVQIGDGETWVRIPSAIFATGSVYAFYILSRRLFGAGTASVAGMLMIVNAFFIEYAQEARSYSLVLLATIVSSYVFVRAVEDSTIASWLTYAAIGSFAFYAHPFAVLVLVGHLASLAVRHPRPRWTHVGMAYGAIALAATPLVILLLAGDPLQRAFASGASLGAVKALFLNLTGGYGVPGGFLLLLAYFGACCLALIVVARAFLITSDARRRWSYGFVISWLGVPIATSFVVSLARPTLVPRYLIVALPALLLLASIGITQFLGRRLAIGATLAVVLFGLYSLGHYYSADYKNGENWNAAVSFVTSQVLPGDGIIFLSHFGRQPFEYYLEESPQGLRKLKPIYPGGRWTTYIPVLSESRLESTNRAAATLESYDRVWTVLLWMPNNHDNARPIERVLSRKFVEADYADFGSEMQVRLSIRRNSVGHR
jgi:mannosyltransferase